LVGGLRVTAFGCESLECGHADPPACAAPLKGNQFAAFALAKVGNLALCHERIPAVWPNLAVVIQEGRRYFPHNELVRFGIARQSFTPATTATRSEGQSPLESLQLAQEFGAQVQCSPPGAVRENRVQMSCAGVAMNPAEHGADPQD